MEPALLSGDKILVDKWTGGARLFNIFASLRGEEVDIYRLPGFGSFQRDDVLVFNFPYQDGSDSIGFDIMKYYVKRCIALPGDTLEIRKGYYHIKGITDSVGNVQAQHRIARVRREDSHGIVMDAFPWDGRLGWTIQEFGPLPVPAKGQVVKIDTLSCLLYGRLIHWEQKKRLRQKGEAVCLGDSAITEYKFTENYYFVSGDNMENSKDSRYWGMLPESYIVGRAFTIWRSDDPLRGKIRWNRVFKKNKMMREKVDYMHIILRGGLLAMVCALLSVVWVNDPMLPAGELSGQWLYLAKVAMGAAVGWVVSAFLYYRKGYDMGADFYQVVIWSFIVLAASEAIYGLRQLYGFTSSHHSLYSLTGSFLIPDRIPVIWL